MDKRRLLLIVVFSFATAYLLHVASEHLRLSANIDAKVTVPATSVSPASRSLRPNYPYSVIPGGVYSPAELRSAVGRDAVVGGHYSDFNFKSARLVTLTDDRFQYVSYRVKNRIYWTRNKLRIPKGEVLLSDGSNFARTRCGNRLSSQPKADTAAQQPPERLLSLPPFTPALLKKGEVTLAPPPPVADLAVGGPALPLDLPQLTPYLPLQDTAGLPLSQQIGPSLQSYPTGAGVGGAPPIGPGFLPVVPGGPGGPIASPGTPLATTPVSPVVPVTPILPATPGAPGAPPRLPVLPILPILPVAPGTPAPPVSTVPEPANLSLFAASFCGWLWLLARVMRTDARSKAETRAGH